MATDLRFDSELARVVEQAQACAVEAEEVLTAATSIESPLSSEARRIVASWLNEAGYDRAVALVEAEEPDLRTE